MWLCVAIFRFSVTHGLRIGAGRSIVTTMRKAEAKATATATAAEIENFRFDI
jgi:hypothetical protein